MINDWIKTKVLFWLLNAWIIILNFSNAFSVFEYLISFTKRELKIQTFVNTFLLLTDINTSFSNKSTISFCRDAMNDDTTDSAIVLKMKLTIDAKNFLSWSRSRLIDSMNIIKSIMISICSEINLIDDSSDDLINDSIDDSVDKNCNSSLLSTWSFW